MRSTFIAAIIAGMFMVGFVATSHAGEAYLRLEQIPGGSIEPRHTGWLKLQSYSWGAENGGSSARARMSSGGGRQPSRPDWKTLSITMQLDGSFPKMAVALGKGQYLPEAEIHEIYPTGDRMPFFKIKLTDVFVESVELSSDRNGAPVVNASFAYNRIEWTFTVRSSKTGRKGGDIQGHWDLKSNQGG